MKRFSSPSKASVGSFLLLSSLVLLGGCATEAPPQATVPVSTPTESTPSTAAVFAFGQVPTAWTLTGSHSFYARLYDASRDAVDMALLLPEDIESSTISDADMDKVYSADEEIDSHLVFDPAISAVAADLVVQYYYRGSKPLEERGNDLVVWRTRDLAYIPTEQMKITSEEEGEAFPLNEVKLFVREAALLTGDSELFAVAAGEVCKRYRPWWLTDEEPDSFPDSETYIITSGECLEWIREVREAVERERMLQSLRQELGLVSYGEEFLWDGELAASPREFRSYDLLLDIAGAGNILGGAPFDSLFESGNQGEQCDSGNCKCVYPNPARCGDRILQRGAEQCDDGNRFAGDGCDVFCQVEQNYCGDDVAQNWEECSEKRECPDGSECSDFTDCRIAGNTPCGFGDNELEKCLGLVWDKTCRFSGTTCEEDSDCPCPSYVPAAQCERWKKDSCRYSAAGVCWVGGVGNGIIEGSPCTEQADCSGVSTCTNEGFCTNHPYRSCSRDEQCYSCSAEEITGTCYESGEKCNGNEDCSITEYCILEPENICRPRTIGGVGGNRSNCNGFCEEKTFCGDHVVYLTEGGDPEECDDGMHCADRTPCFPGQNCNDGSTCEARDGFDSLYQDVPFQSSCTAECKIQLCGDGTITDQEPEQCDDGSFCDDLTTPCSPTAPSVCIGIGNDLCAPRSDDGCSATCQVEMCGDKILQEKTGEQCDDGGVCSNGSACTTQSGCPLYSHCEGTHFPCTNDFDCSYGSACVPANTNATCTPQNNDGCTDQCEREFCGDGTTQPNEQCDDGNTDTTDGCAACKPANCGDGFVWAGNEECDPGAFMGFGVNCSATCTIPPPPPPLECTGLCGDGCIRFSGENPEECDDANTNSGDGCSSDCKREYCGDGVPDSNGPDNIDDTADDEACDDGGTCFVGASGSCRVGDPEACAETSFVCENGGGACSDASDCNGGTCTKIRPECVADSCDACDNECNQVVCGNSVLQCGEECDDGNTATGDGCNSDCELEFCGDGTVQSGLNEACDDGWGNSDTEQDSCRTNCTLPRCGDGIVDASEECDVPTCPNGSLCKNHNDCGGFWCTARGGLGCSTTCQKEGCGDGILQDSYGEACDDGNTVSGDGCSSVCVLESTYCGNGVVDPEGTDNWPFTPDDETCDYAESMQGSCPDVTGSAGLMGCDAYGSDDILGTLDDEVCDLGTCNPSTKRCTNASSFVCMVDSDCQAACIPTCTPFCKVRAMSCGDGYRDPDEQCDDGNEVNGDGCSSPYCKLERPDLCGNGRLDKGEECDQMHRTSTIECTPFCQFPQDVPECGDGHKDPSGALRGNVLERLLTFSEGYRLDGRWPSNREMTPNWTGSAHEYQEGGGWYVTPRVFDKTFDRVLLSGGQNLNQKYEGPRACSLCGNSVLDRGEQCDSGRLSNGSYPMKRYNAPAWERLKWSLTYATRTLPSYWNWYSGLYPFGFHSFDYLLRNWYLTGNPAEIARLRGYYGYNFYGSWYDPGWWLNDLKHDEERAFVMDSCSSSCKLSRCGDDRIDPGETCDDDNRQTFFLSPQNGDGCSSTCMLEAGFSFTAGSIEWPGGTQKPMCGDDVVTSGEQCDEGGECIRRDGNSTKKYCRREPGHTFCDLNGSDDIFPSADDEIECTPVPDDGCDENCQIEPLGICGNKKIEPYEECDLGDKNGTQGAACSAQCLTVISSSNSSAHQCGNGTVDHGEECDDGNQTLLDGCTHCLVDLCGNGLLDSGEHCDDSNRISGDGCSMWCTKENVCGNHEVDFAVNETCDDGNDFDDDGCSSLCRFEYCGDGIPQPGLGEECDEGVQNSLGSSAKCRPDCMLPRCGDDVVDAVAIGAYLYQEVCDPGKHCSHDPTRSCVDSWQCPLGPCDTAAGVCAGGSWKFCTEDRDCGYDGCILQDQIDPATNDVLCTAECTKPVICGDGIMQGKEECDHEGAGCDDCMLIRPDECGNGIIEMGAGEQCDDGNRAGQDGCSETCQFETSVCPGDCFIAFACSEESQNTGEACDPSEVGACPGGFCLMRTECALRCVFGRCGDGEVDPGEQCDDGRQCLHDPSKACSTHVDCGAGACLGADPAKGISGSCADEVERACMTESDCRSLCLPTSGDGCSNTCRHELTPGTPLPKERAALLLCQEEISRIGADQMDEWQRTLLDPERNPFLGWQNNGWWSWYWDFNQRSLTPRFQWGLWTWYGGFSFGGNCRDEPQKCFVQFPNSLGSAVQVVTASLGAVAQHKTMPDRTPLMPFEPTGIVSYAACQEPRAQLASAVEIPNEPPVILPPYHPSDLVRTVERFLCASQGFPRRNFPFLCRSGFSDGGLTAYDAKTLLGSSESSLREMILANTLALGFRGSAYTLDQYIDEAVRVLSESISAALRLLTDLERVEFTKDECPLDASVLCTP